MSSSSIIAYENPQLHKPYFRRFHHQFFLYIRHLPNMGNDQPRPYPRRSHVQLPCIILDHRLALSDTQDDCSPCKYSTSPPRYEGTFQPRASIVFGHPDIIACIIGLVAINSVTFFVAGARPFAALALPGGEPPRHKADVVRIFLPARRYPAPRPPQEPSECGRIPIIPVATLVGSQRPVAIRSLRGR